MRKIIASLLGPLLLSACASLSGSSPALPWDAQVVRGQLANGLEYRLLREASQVGRIDVRLTVKAGSVDETDDQVGVAHLVEHLNFYSQGPESRTVRQQMEQWGWVQGRHYNAVTNYDRTQYLLSPAAGAKQTEQALQALAILMFAANYSAADLERERPIVVEEWRGGLGVAQRMNQQRTASQRIGSRYPAHRTIGNEAAIRAATVEQLKAYQQRWYVPGNMVLSIVGDIDPQALPGLIQQWLGQAPSQALATRDQRELPLDPRLKIVQLQDSQSGGNQVALLFRLHEATSRANTQAGLRERLIDRLTLSALLTQLRQQPRVPGVRSLTVQKSQIGEYSSVLGLAAGVEGDAHPQALRQLLTEIERLRRHGFQPSDLSREQQAIRGIARRMLDQPSPRTFEQWVNDLNDATLQNRPLLPKAEIARLHLAALDGITLAELNQRFKRWSDSPDQVLQLSAPGLTPLTLPTVDQVQALRLEIANSSLDAPATASAAPLVDTTPPPLPVALAPGRVLERQGFAAQQVEHWQLSNGDRLVWLKRNGKQEQQVLLAESSAGFMAFGSLGWRNQMAAQLASQSAPPGWSEPQLQRWRKEQRVSLSLDQQAQRLQLKLSTLPSATPAEPAPNLEGLLQAYRLSQGPLQIDRQDFDKTRADMLGRLARARDNVREQQDQTLRQLQYGQDHWQTPTPEQLHTLQTAQLEADWQRLRRAPVTYYLMADVDAQRLQPLVENQLASIPRGPALSTQRVRQAPGQRQRELHIGLEPRALLQAASYSEQTWTPEDAARVAVLRELARSALKQQLRGEASGVYRLNFDSELNPQNQRIESQLSFSSDPVRVEELWGLARRTLANLPDSIDAASVAKARKQLQTQEALRRTDPETQLHRLVLSERQWGDPRYLSQQHDLPRTIHSAALKPLAKRLFNPQNLVQLRLLPAPAIEDGAR